MAFGVALLSIIGLLAAYIILRNLIGKNAAIIFTAIASFSSVLIEQSRFAWNPNLLPITSFFTLYFFYRMLKDKKIINASIFGSLLSISLQLHYLAIFMFVPISIIGGIALIQSSPKILLLKNISISIFAFLFFSLPLILFDLKHNFLNAKNFLELFSSENVVSKSSFLDRLLETNQQFLSHIFRIELDKTIALILVAALLLALAFAKERILTKNLFVRIHLVSIVSFLLLFSFLTSSRHPHYYNATYLSFFVILSVFVAQIVRKNNILKFTTIFFIGTYIVLNFQRYVFFAKEGNRQLDRAQTIAKSILARSPSSPYQLTAIPFTEIDGHVRYYLEILGVRPLPEDTTVEPKELYVLCYEKDCPILGHPQWQIASFKNATIETMWETLGIKIYKLVHAQ